VPLLGSIQTPQYRLSHQYKFQRVLLAADPESEVQMAGSEDEL